MGKEGNKYQVKELHHDQINEINRRSLSQDLIHINDVVARRVISISKPQSREMDTSALTIPIRHSERADRFLKAEKDVSVEEEFPVNQLILFDIPWLSEQDVGFRFLVGEDCGGCAVCKTADHDHEE